MRKEIIEIGKTVDAAIDSACEKLGCPREDCEWEIIDLPKKGFLGIKNIPAKVRVAIDLPDEKPVKREQPPRREESLRREQPPKREPRPVPEQAKKTEPKAESREREERRPGQDAAAKEQQSSRRTPDPQPPRERPVPLDPGGLTEKEIIARDYIDAVIGEMGLKAEYTVTHEHGGTCINIMGKGLGVIIGRRGETLDAIQYLAGLAANRGDGDYLRLTVDCGDYRLKRKDTLEALARKLASQVLKTDVSKTLEPMNPFERRIIHATVSEIEGVSSSSIGEEPNRRVVITSPTSRTIPGSGFRSGGERGGRDVRRPRREPRPAQDEAEVQAKSEEAGRAAALRGEQDRGYRDRNDRNDRGGRGGRDGRDRRDGRGGRSARPAAPVTQGPPKQTPESETTQGLKFGKIDL